MWKHPKAHDNSRKRYAGMIENGGSGVSTVERDWSYMMLYGIRFCHNDSHGWMKSITVHYHIRYNVRSCDVLVLTMTTFTTMGVETRLYSFVESLS